MAYKTRSEAAGETLGAQLDRLGVTAESAELREGEHILDALVLLRVRDSDAGPGETRLGIVTSTTCDGIIASGLVHQAANVFDDMVRPDDDDDDDESANGA